LNRPASTLQNKVANNKALFFCSEKMYKQMNIIPAKNNPEIAIHINLLSKSLSIMSSMYFEILFLSYHNFFSFSIVFHFLFPFLHFFGFRIFAKREDGKEEEKTILQQPEKTAMCQLSI